MVLTIAVKCDNTCKNSVKCKYIHCIKNKLFPNVIKEKIPDDSRFLLKI